MGELTAILTSPSAPRGVDIFLTEGSQPCWSVPAVEQPPDREAVVIRAAWIPLSGASILQDGLLQWFTVAQPVPEVVQAARAAGWRPGDGETWSPLEGAEEEYAAWVRSAQAVADREVWITLFRGSSVAQQLPVLDEHQLLYRVFAPIASRVRPRMGWGADESGVATWRWEGWPGVPM